MKELLNFSKDVEPTMRTMVIHVQKFQVYALLAIETIETDISPHSFTRDVVLSSQLGNETLQYHLTTE